MTYWQKSWPGAGHAKPERVAPQKASGSQTLALGKDQTPTPPDDSHDRLLKTRDVAELTGLSERTFERMRVTGQGPRFYKLGPGLRARVVYRLSDVKAWIESFGFQSTSEYDR